MLRNIITVLTIIMASPAATQELQSIELKDGAKKGLKEEEQFILSMYERLQNLPVGKSLPAKDALKLKSLLKESTSKSTAPAQ